MLKQQILYITGVDKINTVGSDKPFQIITKTIYLQNVYKKANT